MYEIYCRKHGFVVIASTKEEAESYKCDAKDYCTGKIKIKEIK